MFSSDPLLSAISVSVHRPEDPYADHLREAMRMQRRRRAWRRERTPQATVIKPVAVASYPESSYGLVWLS